MNRSIAHDIAEAVARRRGIDPHGTFMAPPAAGGAGGGGDKDKDETGVEDDDDTDYEKIKLEHYMSRFCNLENGEVVEDREFAAWLHPEFKKNYMRYCVTTDQWVVHTPMP